MVLMAQPKNNHPQAAPTATTAAHRYKLPVEIYGSPIAG